MCLRHRPYIGNDTCPRTLPQVCDFNLSRVMEESVVLSSMVASNPRWLAPEILAGLPYTVAADVYSFGIIMWELLTWEVPWHQQNTWQVRGLQLASHTISWLLCTLLLWTCPEVGCFLHACDMLCVLICCARASGARDGDGGTPAARHPGRHCSDARQHLWRHQLLPGPHAGLLGTGKAHCQGAFSVGLLLALDQVGLMTLATSTTFVVCHAAIECFDARLTTLLPCLRRVRTTGQTLRPSLGGCAACSLWRRLHGSPQVQFMLPCIYLACVSLYQS